MIENLSSDFSIIAYFYNPNIWPYEEYMKRLNSARKIAQVMKVPLIEGPYENSVFEEKVKHLTYEKEGGERCNLCYRIRLEKTADFTRRRGIEIFTTTLSISPHKDARLINSIGNTIAKAYGINFYEADFKKKNGFMKSVQISKKLELYRQRYCGCRYSLPLDRR